MLFSNISSYIEINKRIHVKRIYNYLNYATCLLRRPVKDRLSCCFLREEANVRQNENKNPFVQLTVVFKVDTLEALIVDEIDEENKCCHRNEEDCTGQNPGYYQDITQYQHLKI